MIDCGPPSVPRNGIVSLPSGTHLNDYAHYSCTTGYTVEGSERRRCQESGLWSGNMPGCLGKYAAVYYAFCIRVNFLVEFSLESKHRHLLCPCCLHVAIDCGPPPPLLNGTVTTNSTRLDGVATYNCTTGYRLTSANNTLLCALTGLWTGTLPSCAGKRLPVKTSVCVLARFFEGE